MANNLFEQSFSGNYPKVLGKQMMFQTMKEFFWGPFAKFNTFNSQGRPVTASEKFRPKPVQSPIVIQNELKKSAGDIMEIPVHRNLKDKPQAGKKQLMGHEERPAVNFAQVPIQLVRHAELPQDSSMSTQVNKEMRLLENTRPALQRHYTRVSEYLGATYGFYYGYSWNIFDSGWFASNSKIGWNPHPHIYCAGYGKVPYTSGYPGTSGYATLVGTRANAVGAGDVFDTGFLQALKADPQIRKIAPIILKEGVPLRLIVAHPWQIATLENDSAFREVVAQAMVQKYSAQNPFLIGAKYIYAGFAIFESDTAVWSVSVSSGDYADSGDVVFGPENWHPDADDDDADDLEDFEDYTSADKFAAIVLGNNAMFKGMVSGIDFKKREDDYGELIGIGYKSIEGYARADFWNRDDGTTGQYLINDSSALAITAAAAPSY